MRFILHLNYAYGRHMDLNGVLPSADKGKWDAKSEWQENLFQ